MLNKIEYDNNLNRLIQSIIIKIEEAAYQVQYYIHEQYGAQKPDIFLDDKRTWKYYLNLSGRYHSLDTPMYIYNRYINQDMLLTIDNINRYPILKAELLEFSIMYKTLVAQYPSQEGLIKSILLPVDIDYAISAETGTILSYNTNLIDRKEYSLVYKLQDFIYGFFGRYYISDYALVDNLYIASIYVTLYPAIMLKIENLRLENMLTYEAHDYHIGLFFKSHLNIDLELDVLPDKVVMWLYKNIRYIERHTGKQKVFELIMDKILELSNVGMGEIILIKEDSQPNETANIYEPSYIAGGIGFKTKQLNNRYIVNKNRKYTLDQIVKKELILTDNENLDSESILNNEIINTNKTRKLSEYTKIIEVDDKIIMRSRTIPELHVLIDNWFYYAFSNKYNYTTEVNDFNTNKIYKVNAKQAALMLIKLFIKVVGEESRVLKSFKVSSIIRYEQGLDSSINRLFLDRGMTDNLTNAIFNSIPELPTSFKDGDTMKEYLLKVNDLNNLFWYSICNSGNAVVSATIKRLQERVYVDKYLDLTIYGSESSIEARLEHEGIDYTITDNYDYISMMKLLTKTFTGLGFNTTDEDNSDMEKYISLIKKMTSYSLQIIHNPITSSSIESPYTAEEVIMLSNPLISCTSAKFNPLEDFKGSLFSKEFKWLDYSTPESESAEIVKPVCDGMFGFNYFIDRNDYRRNNSINLSMSQDFKCIYAYSNELEVEASVAKKTYVENYVTELDWIDEDLILAHSTTMLPTISDSKTLEPSIGMSIDARDVDINNTLIDAIGFNFNREAIDITNESEIGITYTQNENEIAVLNKDKEVNNLSDLISINMSIDLSGIELVEYQEIEDVILFTGEGVIIKDSLVITDYDDTEV